MGRRRGGATLTVVGLSGTVIRLADQGGWSSAVQLAFLLASDGFEVVGTHSRRLPPQAGLLDTLPKQVQDEALWWERHLLEVIRGLPQDAPAGARSRPEYDPAQRSLTRRGKRRPPS